MIGKKLLNQGPQSLADVKEVLEKRKKEGELSYEQNLTLEYCKKFTKLKKKKAVEAIKELAELEKMNEKHAIALIDIMPEKADDVKLIFSKEHFILSDEEIKAILDVLGNYRGG